MRCSSKADPARPTGQPSSNSTRVNDFERPTERKRDRELSAISCRKNCEFKAVSI